MKKLSKIYTSPMAISVVTLNGFAESIVDNLEEIEETKTGYKTRPDRKSVGYLMGHESFFEPAYRCVTLEDKIESSNYIDGARRQRQIEYVQKQLMKYFSDFQVDKVTNSLDLGIVEDMAVEYVSESYCEEAVGFTMNLEDNRKLFVLANPKAFKLFTAPLAIIGSKNHELAHLGVLDINKVMLCEYKSDKSLDVMFGKAPEENLPEFIEVTVKYKGKDATTRQIFDLEGFRGDFLEDLMMRGASDAAQRAFRLVLDKRDKD